MHGRLAQQMTFEEVLKFMLDMASLSADVSGAWYLKVTIIRDAARITLILA